MRTKSLWSYIYFGIALQYLRDAEGHAYPVHGDRYALRNIDRVLEIMDELELVVTRRAANKLHELRKELEQRDKDHKLTKDESKKLTRIMEEIKVTLRAEALGKVSYIVSDKRLDVNKLLSGVSGLLAPEVFNLLPDIAKYDFQEAGKCIAFELPTSAAFHLLRGTEAVLRAFYLFNVKRNRIQTLLWGPMVAALRQRRKPLPAPLLDNLDNIRRSFRNPTQHPEKIYDIQEAQDLFALCVDVVNRMVPLMK